MEIIFLPPSDKELEEAVCFYEDQLIGLGKQFYAEVTEALEFIVQYPDAWYKIGPHTRRFILKRFPYLVLYIFEKDKIIITAIAHQHRYPKNYLNRIPQK